MLIRARQIYAHYPLHRLLRIPISTMSLPQVLDWSLWHVARLQTHWSAASSRSRSDFVWEKELEYYQATILFLQDALDEIIEAKEKGDMEIANLSCRINVQNTADAAKEGIRQENIELNRKIDEIIASKEGIVYENVELRSRVNDLIAAQKESDRDNIESKIQMDEVIAAKEKGDQDNIELELRINKLTITEEKSERENVELKRQINNLIATEEKTVQANTELRHQIEAQNEGIRILEVELSYLRGERGRLRSDELLINAPRASQSPMRWERPLKEWKSHDKMFLTARIKPCGDVNPDLGHDLSSVDNDSQRGPCIVLEDPNSHVKTWHPFDHCFAPQDTNKTIWEEYKDLLLEGLFSGHLVAIATDGPSGSGKTYTLFKGKDALISTTIHNILQHPENNGKAVQVRAVEIYKNAAVDMLGRGHASKSERLEGTPKTSRRKVILWRDCETHDFASSSTLEQIRHKILSINDRRINKDTVMNTSRSPLRGGSSRGHLVLIINRAGSVNVDDVGRLVFIDLAGTEERGMNDGDIDAEYDDIRKDRSECYAFFRTLGRSIPAHGDRALTKLLKSLLRRPNVVGRATKIAHILHFSITDRQRNMWLIAQKKELENAGAAPAVARTL